MNKKVKHGTLLTIIFAVLSLLYVYPIILVFINSFKKKAYISKAPFEIPTGLCCKEGWRLCIAYR